MFKRRNIISASQPGGGPPSPLSQPAPRQQQEEAMQKLASHILVFLVASLVTTVTFGATLA